MNKIQPNSSFTRGLVGSGEQISNSSCIPQRSGSLTTIASNMPFYQQNAALLHTQFDSQRTLSTRLIRNTITRSGERSSDPRKHPFSASHQVDFLQDFSVPHCYMKLVHIRLLTLLNIRFTLPCQALPNLRGARTFSHSSRQLTLRGKRGKTSALQSGKGLI